MTGNELGKNNATDASPLFEQNVGGAKTMLDRALKSADNAFDEVSASVDETVIDIKRFGSSIPQALNNPLDKIKSAMEKKISKATEDLEAALPTITKAGFELISLDIEVGTMPKIIPRFKIIKEISKDKRDAVKREAATNRMTKSILMALINTQLISKIKIGGLQFKIIELHMGTIPKARIRFEKV